MVSSHGLVLMWRRWEELWLPALPFSELGFLAMYRRKFFISDEGDFRLLALCFR